jgi:ATP-dependent Clp protease ATP-binding subunit ClpB
MLQILDDGRVTDAQGHTVDFKNSIIIMTSNIGSSYILDLAGDDSQYEEMRSRVMEAMRNSFRPEFLNRIDEIIIFHALQKHELRHIVQLQIQRLEQRLADRKMSLKLSDAALDFLAEVGYDPVFGARPFKASNSARVGDCDRQSNFTRRIQRRRHHFCRCRKRASCLQAFAIGVVNSSIKP